MARRKRAKTNFGRILGLLCVLAVMAAAGWYGYRHWHVRHTGERDSAAPAPETPAEAKHVTVNGQLSVAAPARDMQIGIAAPAAVLLRHVEMFEWIEQCRDTHDGMQDCTYAKGWSTPMDSRKFHEHHDNPKPPFAEARFRSAEIRLDKLSVDPALVEAQLKSVDYPVHDKDLPPNMAATFTVHDGMLYAGGDPAQPAVGTVRISYRVIPTGPATLTGTQKGGHLTQ